jgi:Fic family protein
MSKKDYVMIAEIFRMTRVSDEKYNEVSAISSEMWKNIRNMFVNKLAEENPKFDKEKFISFTEKKRATPGPAPEPSAAELSGGRYGTERYRELNQKPFVAPEGY